MGDSNQRWVQINAGRKDFHVVRSTLERSEVWKNRLANCKLSDKEYVDCDSALFELLLRAIRHPKAPIPPEWREAVMEEANAQGFNISLSGESGLEPMIGGIKWNPEPYIYQFEPNELRSIRMDLNNLTGYVSVNLEDKTEFDCFALCVQRVIPMFDNGSTNKYPQFRIIAIDKMNNKFRYCCSNNLNAYMESLVKYLGLSWAVYLIPSNEIKSFEIEMAQPANINSLTISVLTGHYY